MRGDPPWLPSSCSRDVSTRRKNAEIGDRSASLCPTPSLGSFSSHFSVPPLSALPRLYVFSTGEGTGRAVQAQRAAELRQFLSLAGSSEVAALRLPGLPKWGQSSRSPKRQLGGRGKEGPPNSSSASPLHPFLAPALGESGVWRLVIISSHCFVVHGFSCCPGAFPLFAHLCLVPPRHTSVDDEEGSAGDSGPLRTGTGIRAANARATCPGPAQRQRYGLGRSR